PAIVHWVGQSNVNITASIPPTLIAKVKGEQKSEEFVNKNTVPPAYEPTTLVYNSGNSVPALAVGVPLSGYYQLYYVFPFTQQQATLLLVQRVLVGVALAVIVLLAAIASLVTRWVVLPVRHAAAAARSVELLQSQLDRFESLLVDLLEISRFDAGAATLDADLVDVCDLVRRSADDAQQLAERRGSRIEFRLPATGCFAEADRRRVERILRNILVNAVEHGEGKEVVVTTAMDSDAVAISVRDYGVGLRPGEEHKVFDRFWRADPARARSTGGTGLGLAISLEDARLHGG